MEEYAGATRAFDDLRAEVAILRRAVEALPEAFLESRSPDPGPQFDILGEGLDEIAEQVDRILSKPMLSHTPEEQGKAIARASNAMFDETSKIFLSAAHDSMHLRNALVEAVGHVRTKSDQWLWVASAAAIGIICGILVLPFLARALPVGADSALATFVMHGDDRWNAGQALMQIGNPEGWKSMNSDLDLVSRNKSRIQKCLVEAAKPKGDQRCIIEVSPE